MILKTYLVAAAARLSTYASNDQPLAAAGNKVALVLAGNTPFYPMYVVGLVGSEGMPTLLMTLFSFPFFATIPAISRRYPLLGRATLSIAGSANTVFCTWLLGERSGTELFLIPCITLASLLFGTGERVWALLLAALPLGAYILLHGHFWPPPHLYQDSAYSALFSKRSAWVRYPFFSGSSFQDFTLGRRSARISEAIRSKLRSTTLARLVACYRI